MDTGSRDGSADEAAAWVGEDVVLVAPPMPGGWEPRDWARHAGVAATDEELILFVAPDTILAPVAARGCSSSAWRHIGWTSCPASHVT